MAESPPTLLEADEHDRYPVHEEDTVPEVPRHFRQSRYVAGAIEVQRPDCWVTGNICLYWEPGNYRLYVAPDVVVVDCPTPPDDLPRVWLRWSDPPLLFVAEFGSRSTFQVDTGPKLEVYAENIGVPEYLYADPPRGDLRLWRLQDGIYQPVRRDADDRLWSERLRVGFGYDDAGFLRVYSPEGDIVPTHPEGERQRVEAERQWAEAERLRIEAETRAQEETRRRAEAEQRAAELAAEIERLRRGAADESPGR
jgi:Uma2 family endonuclease